MKDDKAKETKDGNKYLVFPSMVDVIGYKPSTIIAAFCSRNVFIALYRAKYKFGSFFARKCLYVHISRRLKDRVTLKKIINLIDIGFTQEMSLINFLCLLI